MRRDAAFQVVEQFEQALCDYTGAPFCVTTDSCTNALYLALRLSKIENPHLAWTKLKLPARTYVGVVHAARNAEWDIEFTGEEWVSSYQLHPTLVIDSAKRFQRDMFDGGYVCLSFQAGKIFPIGRGGAILTDNAEAADWLRKARLDGRTGGADYADNTYQSFGAHCYMTPPDAARGLWLLTYAEDGADDTWESYPDLSEATWT